MPDVGSLGKVNQILEALDADGRHRLLGLAQKKHVPAGDAVFREGDKGDDFFVIAKGRVRITVDDAGTQKDIAELDHGSLFGEMAVLDGGVRSATVTALEELDLVAFPGPAVEALLKQYPKAREALHRIGLLRAEQLVEKASQ
jgi:CRP-like cAMP-binding protein